MTLRLTLLALFASTSLSAATLAVNLSGTTNQAFANKLQDTDVQVARFVIQAAGGDVIVDAVTVSVSNTANAANAFTGVRLFFDADGNGSFDPSEELSVVQLVAAGAATFTETFTALNGLFRELQVRVNIGADVSIYGEAFQFSVAAAGSITLPAVSTDTVTGIFPVTANAITIRNSTNQLVPGSGNPATPRTVAKGTQNAAALHFILDSQPPTTPGELVGIDLQSVAISATLQTAAETAAVADLSLWQDDGDGLFEPGAGEVLILRRTPADLGKWTPGGNVITATFDGTVITVLPPINTGQARAIWVSVSFAAGAQCVCEVSVNRINVLGSLGAAADFFVTNPSSIAGEVITVQDLPGPPEPPEAQGEGGCIAGARVALPAVLLLLTAGFTSMRRRKICKLRRV